MSLTRPDLAGIPSYVAGRSPADIARDAGVSQAVKLASNEVPYGPLPGVVEAITAAMTEIHRYPDNLVVALREKIAATFGLDPACVVTGTGSVGLTEHLVRAACLPDDEVIYAWRSFELYPIITAGSKAVSVRIPNTATHEHDIERMAAAVTDRTRVLFVCSPNNPTGTAVRRDAVEWLLEQVGPDVLVVLDAAYQEFVRDEAVGDALDIAAGRDNVLVLRTFSKAWGLAGLRAGWLVAPAPVATTIQKLVTPFALNNLVQQAAIAALDQQDEVRRRVDLVLAERARVLAELLPRCPEIPESHANFLWLPLGADSVDFAAQCEKRGVIVRPFADTGVRVSIGTRAENDRFLTAAAEILVSP